VSESEPIRIRFISDHIVCESSRRDLQAGWHVEVGSFGIIRMPTEFNYVEFDSSHANAGSRTADD
jgi:hypothetical protein